MWEAVASLFVKPHQLGGKEGLGFYVALLRLYRDEIETRNREEIPLCLHSPSYTLSPLRFIPQLYVKLFIFLVLRI